VTAVRIVSPAGHTVRMDSGSATVHRNDPDVIRRLLKSPGRWAVVGLSANPGLGMQIVPVHPRGDTVHGEPGYRTLTELAASDAPIDVVDVFVRSELAGEVVDQAIAVGAKAVWLQLGVIDEAAAARARSAGLDVVMDTCPAIEFPELDKS
jgi:predicted CoA-binding protein